MNQDRLIGAGIFFILGAALVVPSVWPAWEQVKEIVKQFELMKFFWCLGAVFIGFALNALKASRKKEQIATGAWPSYLTKYTPLLLIAALFIYFAVDVYTFDHKRYFYCLALLIGVFVGYDADRAVNRPSRFFRDSGSNTAGP
jgi:hypothetical protein